MDILIIAVGKLKEACIARLIDDYLKRLRPLLPRLGFTGIAVRELVESRKRTAAERKAEEAAAIRKAAGKNAALLLLDERGESPDSRAFAQRLTRLSRSGEKRLAIVIGGPDGLDESLKREAEALISFGRMTWPHQLVRLMLAEQLYRAASIAAGHPYHRD